MFLGLVKKGAIKPAADWKPPEVPLDLEKAVKAGKVGPFFLHPPLAPYSALQNSPFYPLLVKFRTVQRCLERAAHPAPQVRALASAASATACAASRSRRRSSA